MNDVTNTSGLLVSNPVATEHLIKCMVSKERGRRPTILEVSKHPCWNGTEVECNFEYSGDDEIDDNVPEKAADETSQALVPAYIERLRNLLSKTREMGYNRKPMIAIFEDNSKQLHRFNPASKSLTKMHKYPEHRQSPKVVTLGEYIYAIFSEPNDSGSDLYFLYRLEYCDVLATWQSISFPDWINEGEYLRIASSSDSIFLIGAKSVSKYDTLCREWKRLPDVPYKGYPAVVSSNGFLYCIGSRGVEIGNRVDRFNVRTVEWERIADMIVELWYLIATRYEENIYAVGYNSYDMIHIENYNPTLDRWTNLTRTRNLSEADFGTFRILRINRDFYMVSYQGHILKYDPVKNEWSNAASYPDMKFYHAASVKMSE